MNVARLPLSALRLAPENARHASKGEVSGLATSIAAEGLLDPLHAYLDGKTVMVWDGGRRLRALKSLAKSKRLPRELEGGVPVIVSDQAAARRRSLVTFVRENMHPAEEFAAYKALFDAGQDPDQIAGSLGVDARRVAQLLKLCNLAPEILEAFGAGAYGLDTAQAFTLTDDHDRQREVLAACGDWIQAGRVRQLLRSGMVSARDRLARFIGRDAYIAAGGGVQVDLFTSDQDGETWTDSGLVERLAAEKLDAVVAAVTGEGWAWVTVVDPYDYNWGHGFQRPRGERITLSDEDQAAYDAAAAVIEDGASDADAFDAAEGVIADLEIKSERGEMTAKQRATAGAFVQVDSGGLLTIRRGYVKDAPSATATTGKGAAAADPALYGWGHTGHWHMTHIATAAVRHALLKDTSAAYDILVAGLAWGIVGGAKGPPALKLEPRGVNTVGISAEARLTGEEAWGACRQAWRDRLPDVDFRACFDFVLELTADEKAQIVALGVGMGLDAVEPRFDQRQRGAWAQLGIFAARAGVAIEDAWTPDQTFLAKGSKAALMEALDETGGSDAYGKAKKSELVSVLTQRVGPRKWLPKLLKDLVP